MSISISEYHEIINGRATLAEIEKRHKAKPVKVSKSRKPKAEVKPELTMGEILDLTRRGVNAFTEVQNGQAANDGTVWAGVLPWTPSMNHYWRHDNGCHHISKAGLDYRAEVVRIVRGATPIKGRAALLVFAFPPDNRRRDLDNLLKGLQDALVHGGLLADDSDIDLLGVYRRGLHKPGGKVVVVVMKI